MYKHLIMHSKQCTSCGLLMKEVNWLNAHWFSIGVSLIVVNFLSKWGHWCHYGDIIMVPIASKSPASPLFTQPFIQAQIRENIKAPSHGPLCGEFTGDRLIPRTNGQWFRKCFHLLTSSCVSFPSLFARQIPPLISTDQNLYPSLDLTRVCVNPNPCGILCHISYLPFDIVKAY